MTESDAPALPIPHTSQPMQGAVVTEAITTTAVAGEMGEGSSISFDVQMIEELLKQPCEPFTDPSFAMGGVAPTFSSFMPTVSVSSVARSSREEEILAEISAEMAAVMTAGDSGGDVAPPSLTPSMVTSPTSTVITSSVEASPPVTASPPPVRPHKRISIPSSSEEDVDIMPDPEDAPKKDKKSRRKPGSGSSGSTPKKRPRKKKE